MQSFVRIDNYCKKLIFFAPIFYLDLTELWYIDVSGGKRLHGEK